MEQNPRKMLSKYYQDWLDRGEGEAIFMAIEEVLTEHPECLDIFIEKFHIEQNKSEKETLAEIILRHQPYQPAIHFLKNEMGWDDFTGFAGFPES